MTNTHTHKMTVTSHRVELTTRDDGHDIDTDTCDSQTITMDSRQAHSHCRFYQHTERPFSDGSTQASKIETS